MTDEKLSLRATRVALPMRREFYVRDSCGNISGAPTESGCRESARYGMTLVEVVTYRFETKYERSSTPDNDPLLAAEPDPIAAVRERDATIAAVKDVIHVGSDESVADAVKRWYNRANRYQDEHANALSCIAAKDAEIAKLTQCAIDGWVLARKLAMAGNTTVTNEMLDAALDYSEHALDSLGEPT